MLSDLASEWAFPPRFSGQSAAFGNAHTWCKALQQGFVLKFRRRVMKMHVTCTATPRGMWTNVGQVSKPISAKVGVKGRSTWENAAAGGGGWGESGPNWCGNQKHGREASVGLMGGGVISISASCISGPGLQCRWREISQFWPKVSPSQNQRAAVFLFSVFSL